MTKKALRILCPLTGVAAAVLFGLSIAVHNSFLVSVNGALFVILAGLTYRNWQP